MFYTAWYICCAVRLTEKESRSVMRLVEALENTELPITQRRIAAQEIVGINPLVGSALVPFLVERLMTEVAQKVSDEEEDLYEIYGDELENAILQFLGDDEEIKAQVQQLRSADCNAVLEYVRTTGLELPEYHEGFSPYQDADLYVKESFILALLVSVGELDPSLLREFISGVSELKIRQLAQAGKLGQICWNLAKRLEMILAEDPREVISRFPDRWQERPDLVELVMPYLFPVNLEADKGIIQVKELFEEAVSLKEFSRYWRNSKSEWSNPFWLWPGASKEDCVRASIIIWQHIIWNLAFVRNPGHTVHSLQRLWSAPTYRYYRKDEKAAQHTFTYYQKCMIPRGIKLEKEEFAGIYICSPWQRRTESVPDDSPGIGEKEEWEGEVLFHAFKHFARNDNALKAFCAVRLLSRIVQYVKDDINVNYITLLLNLADAFSCFGARNTFEIMEGRGDLQIRSLAWNAPVRILGFYADKVIDEIGMGHIDADMPAEIMEKIQKRSPYLSEGKAKGTNSQILLVYRFGGLFCAARWALLALRDFSARFDGAINPWLEGGPKSHVVRLVSYLYVIMGQEDEKTKVPYRLPKDSMELFYAMTEIEEVGQYELADPGFSEDEPERIGLDALVLRNNPSEAVWRCMGAITPERFAGEVYGAALTNRLRAQLESAAETCEMSGVWFDQWKKLMEDPKRRSWITHLVKLTLLKLLKVKLVDGNSISRNTVDYILRYFAEEKNDNPIYYYQIIADRLIGHDDGAGPYEMSKWRGDFAAQLYKRCRETEGNPKLHDRWRGLYYYFLGGIREDLCDGQSLANEQVVKQWNFNVIHSWNLQTFMKDLQEWDPIQDRFWAEEQGRLLTVGSQLDTSMRFEKRYTITDQYRKIPQEYNQWKVGVIAKVSNREISFYLGDETNAVYVIEDSSESRFKVRTRYHVGDIYGVRISEPGKVERVKGLGILSTQKGYIEVSRVHIVAAEISIQDREQQTVYSIQDAEELFLLWSGDTVDFLEKGMQDIRNVQVAYCEYDDGKYGWVPKERDLDELLLRYFFREGKQKEPIVLTYLKSIDEDKLLFSVAAGENYVLRREYFTEVSWGMLQSRLFGEEERGRMRIRVHLTKEKGFPRLEVPGNDAFDDVNVRWAQLFNTQKPYQIRFENKRWVLDCEMPEVRPVLQASVVGSQDHMKLFPGKRYNVEVTSDGWSLCEMRGPRVKVTFYKTRVLDGHISYEEFQKLVNLKPGMVFKLGDIRTRLRNSGYRYADLENKMQVCCADESISFLKDWTTEKFGKGRLCIVDNMREIRSEGAIPEDVRGVWPTCLEGTEHPVSGILAEFAPNIDTEENFMLKVFLDLDGKMRSVDVPRHAFWPGPDNLGERIDAVRTPEGWIFKVTKRKGINVRALWKMVFHDASDVKVLGEPLGIVALTRSMMRAVTQDTREPLLHVYENRMAQRPVLKEQCGVTLGKGNVHFLQLRFSDSHCFPWAYKTSVVELKVGANSFVGEARGHDFKDNRTGWNVHAQVHKVYVEEECEYYDLRRIFTRTRSVKAENPQDLTGREEWIRNYKEWYFSGERHALASFVGDYKSASKVLLHNFRVPTALSHELEKAEFTNTVELECDHEPIVRGHEGQYMKEDIRVRLKIVGDKWVASVKDAQVWSLDRKFIDYYGFKSEIYTVKTFYFAGRDEEGKLVFEWGMGHCFRARNEDIVDDDGGTFLYEFFFGDSIRAITFVMDPEGEYGWKARIRQEDISHEIEGKIWQDSYENIVQLLRVEKDTETGHIEIKQVSARTKHISIAGSKTEAWKWYERGNTFLSDDSQSRLQKEIGAREKMTVFAHINEELSGRENRDLFFEYISLDIRAGQLGLLENKILCLQAYQIEETGDANSRNRIANDYRISFYLPEELPTKCEKPRLVMTVNRRKFSLDESRLRLDAHTDPDKYVGNNMLVSLGELSTVERAPVEERADKDQEDYVTHYWRGSVISAPRRTLESLKQWLVGMPPYLVTLACNERQNRGGRRTDAGRKVYAEIAPGIICDITRECTNLQIMRGTYARLSVENGKLCTRIFLLGDTKYFSAVKRPAELLIMDDRLNHYTGLEDENAAEEEDKRSHFTVASFPQILLRNRALMDKLIREGLPRIGVVHVNKHGEFEVEENEEFKVGNLDIRQEDFAPVVNVRRPVEQSSVSRWSRITFRDGTVSEIVDSVHDGKWHYHDRNTGQYMEYARNMIRYNLPDGEDFREIVTFYAPGKRLRYKVKELEIYGMSAREILEHGLPRNNRWYPIAAGCNDSVWIEFFPGKVADISANYIMAGNMQCRLSGLRMDTFGAGDEVLLVGDKTNTGGQYGVLLMDFRFSGRDAVGNHMALLPVSDVLEDGLVLGGGIYSFKYPVVREETVQYCAKEAVILDKDNNLATEVQFGNLQCGMVVYISLDERNNMLLSGMEDVQVSLAYEHFWTNTGWLYKFICYKKEMAFKLFENYIPMTITQIDSKNRKIWVAYQQKLTSEVQEGQSLAVNCIGTLPSRFGDGQVVLRSGNYLFLADGRQILRGVNSVELGKICGRLAERRVGFFITMTRDGWKNGLMPDIYMENIDIELVCIVEAAKGYVVRNMKDLSLKYLPLYAACRVKTNMTEKVWDALVQHPKRTARIMEEDVVSLIDEYRSEESYHNLRLLSAEKGEIIGRTPAGYNERVIPRVFWKEEAGFYYYFSEMYPVGDIILLKSEYELACGQEADPITIELLEGERDNVVVVPAGEKRQKIYLSRWMLANMRENYYRNCNKDADFQGDIQTDRFVENIPRRFRRYAFCKKKASREKNKYLDMELLRDDTRINERLVYLFSKRIGQGEDTDRFRKQCAYTLMGWLAESGRFLANGFAHSGGVNADIDLIPAIAAICFMDEMEIEGKERFRELSVHLARMLGYACGLSIHEEQLIYGWIRQKRYGGEWNKLRHLSLGGEKLSLMGNRQKAKQDGNFDGLLSPTQYKAVIENADSILRLDLLNKQLRKTVYALLLAVADYRDYSEFFNEMRYESYCTVMLAPIGRLLTPAYGRRNSFAYLPEAIRSLLVEAFNKYTDINIELYNGTEIPLKEEERKYWSGEVEKCITLCKEMIKSIGSKR